MVTVKKLSSVFINELAACRHENLLSTIELYKFEGELFVITKSILTTLSRLFPYASYLS